MDVITYPYSFAPTFMVLSTMRPHDRHGVTNERQHCRLFNSLFSPSTKMSALTSCWTNNSVAGYSRRHVAHVTVTVIIHTTVAWHTSVLVDRWGGSEVSGQESCRTGVDETAVGIGEVEAHTRTTRKTRGLALWHRVLSQSFHSAERRSAADDVKRIRTPWNLWDVKMK